MIWACSFGAPIEVAVSEKEMWVSGTQPSRPFAATFKVDGDRLIGTFLYMRSPVRIEMTRDR